MDKLVLRGNSRGQQRPVETAGLPNPKTKKKKVPRRLDQAGDLRGNRGSSESEPAFIPDFVRNKSRVKMSRLWELPALKLEVEPKAEGLFRLCRRSQLG